MKFGPEGKGDHSGDPKVDDWIRRAGLEKDTAKRKQIMVEMQQYMGEQMYMIRPVSGATGFELAWPALRNFMHFRSVRRSEEWLYYWLDSTKRPLG